MAILRERPYGGTNFKVNLGAGMDDDLAWTGFVEVTLPEASVEVIEYRAGNYKEGNPIKLIGLERYTNLVLKRGLCGSMDLYQWWDQVRNGHQGTERTVIVQLLSENHADVVTTWKFRGARPVKYSFSPLNGLESGPVYETVELTFERMEME